MRVDASLLEAGDLALFADSMNQCLMDASWLRIAYWCFRFDRLLEMPFGGAKRSGLVETNCRVLPRDRLTSFGGRGGRRRVELVDRGLTLSFSTGGGGTGDFGESKLIPSGNFGSSGSTN